MDFSEELPGRVSNSRNPRRKRAKNSCHFIERESSSIREFIRADLDVRLRLKLVSLGETFPTEANMR